MTLRAFVLMLALGAGTGHAQTMVLQLYFNNAQRAGTDTDCSIVFSQSRELQRTRGVAAAALRALFAGPSESERADGYRSPFSAATAGLLRSVSIRDGTAHVDLNDPRELLGGATSSCGAAEFHTQIERTLMQFPTVRRVALSIEGRPRIFHEWMGQD